jgi:sarcosine oxidase
MTPTYDIAVIGNGLIGAAASRYLSAAGLRVVAIGPGEPADWQQHQGVFASHYDQGRITRIIDPDPVWAHLAAQSIAAYGEIEQKSGVIFHHRTGGLRISPDATAAGDTLNQAEQIGREYGAVYERLSDQDLAGRFPFLHITPGAVGLWEQGGAGYINPRSLVEAQLTIARAQGAVIIPETVARVEKGQGHVELRTDPGQTITAHKVLVAAGGYTNHLLPRQLDLRPKAVTVVLAELDEAEVRRLHGLTTLIWRLADHPALASIYAAPPTRYPDGKIYLKIGGTLKQPRYLHEPQEFRDWFHSAGNPAEIAALREVLLALLPGLAVGAFASKPCVVTYTAHERPYVDCLEGDWLYVAAGGCGSAAKSSNEIGRMAALLVAKGEWAYELPAGQFTAVTK